MDFGPSPTHLWMAVLLALGAVVAFYRALFHRRPEVETAHLRGRVLTEAESVRRVTGNTADSGLQLGRHCLPARLATGHWAIVGATGSGKTLLQRLLMQSVLAQIRAGSGHRALVYDAKADVISILAGMHLACPVVILNPFDARSVAWDMARDITSPAAALQAATLLVPEAKNDSNPFFTNAARQLLHAVIQALTDKSLG